MLEPVALLLCCRFLAGSSTAPYLSGQPLSLSPDLVESFILAPPPNLSKLINHHQSPRERKASPSSLPGRLSRALSLGTIPSLSRTGMSEMLRPGMLLALQIVILSHFQIQASCLVEVDQPHCTRSLHLQVFNHYFVAVSANHLTLLVFLCPRLLFIKVGKPAIVPRPISNSFSGGVRNIEFRICQAAPSHQSCSSQHRRPEAPFVFYGT